MRRIWIITLFPEYFLPFLDFGVASKGFTRKEEEGKIQVTLVPLRDYSLNNYGSVDEYPIGGGPGMIIRPDVLKHALMEGIVRPGNYGDNFKERLHIVFPGPRGKVWTSHVAKDFAKRVLVEDSQKDVVFICGRYEGIDERFIQLYVDEEISVGDFVLTGGELAVLSILDSASRFVPGVLGNSGSVESESFEDGLLEYPQYTKPKEFEGLVVPEILYSGHHKNIEKYKSQERERITEKNRPDLLDVRRKASRE